MSDLIYGLNHHGKDLRPMAGTLALLCQEMGILWRSRRGGVNSWCFDGPNGLVLVKGNPWSSPPSIEARKREREPARKVFTRRTQIVDWAKAGFPL